MKLFKIIYGAAGVLILTLYLFFGSRGLGQKEKELYQRAYELSGEVESSIWTGYSFKKYPVAVRKGEREYVLQGSDEYKRRAVLPIIAATAYQVDGEMNVFIPSKADLESLGEIAEGLSKGDDTLFISGFSLNRQTISDNKYIAVLYHEGFHAFQMDNYMGNLFNSMPDDEETRLLKLVNSIEMDNYLKGLYDKEREIMFSIINAEDDSNIKEEIKKYVELRQERVEALTVKYGKADIDSLLKLEDYYEKVEGSARYTEIKVAEILEDDSLYQEYLNSLQESASGKEKYYRSGMGICLILDKLDTGWKKHIFSGTDSMYNTLISLSGGF